MAGSSRWFERSRSYHTGDAKQCCSLSGELPLVALDVIPLLVGGTTRTLLAVMDSAAALHSAEGDD